MIPLNKNTKIPVQKNWTSQPKLSLEELLTYKDVNYGIPVKHNHLVVLDIDTHDKEDPNKGFKSLNKLQEFSGQELPETFTVQTPSGGQHWYYRLPDEFKDRYFDKSLTRYPQIDFIVNDKMLVAPPSVIDGDEYFQIKGDLSNIPECPEWLLRMYVKVKPKASVPTEPNATARLLQAMIEQTDEGGRNERLAKICGSLFRTGLDKTSVLFYTRLCNKISNRPPLEDKEVKTIYNSIKRSEDRKRKALEGELKNEII